MGTFTLAARESGDPAKVAQVMHQVSQIAYGQNVTPQMKKDFLIKYGCTVPDIH
jgi:hypothetical protein